MLYSCIMKFLEKFYSTYLNYKRSDMDVLMSVKFNKNKFYCPSYMRENPDCNYIVAYSQTRSIYHEFIAIFFLANIFCELLSIINPRNTLIWSKYEYWKSIFDWKIDPLHECLVQIFFKDFVQIYVWEKKLWTNFCILLLLSLLYVCQTQCFWPIYFLHSTKNTWKIDPLHANPCSESQRFIGQTR